MIYLTRTQIRQVDRRSIEEYHIPGIVLMENAARAVSDTAQDMLNGECACKIVVLCGGGNNGGDGLATARHLHNCGADITVALTLDPAQYKGDALINWKIVEAMKIRAVPFSPQVLDNPRPMLVVDAIFGTGLEQPPRDPFPSIAATVNAAQLPILAVDLPSGMDCETGLPLGECIVATRTVTFVARKTGFSHSHAMKYLGNIIIGEIGCPRELVDEVAAGNDLRFEI